MVTRTHCPWSLGAGRTHAAALRLAVVGVAAAFVALPLGCDLLNVEPQAGDGVAWGEYQFLGTVDLSEVPADSVTVTLIVPTGSGSACRTVQPASDGQVIVQNLPEAPANGYKVAVTVWGRWPSIQPVGTVHPTWCYPQTYSLGVGPVIEWTPGLSVRVYFTENLTVADVRAIVPDADSIRHSSGSAFDITFPSAETLFHGVNRLAVHATVALESGGYSSYGPARPSVILPDRHYFGRVAVGADEKTVCATMDELVALLPEVVPVWWTHLGDTAIFWLSVPYREGLSSSVANEWLWQAHGWLAGHVGIRATRLHTPFPAYSATSYTVKLKPGFALDDLKAMDGTYGLPLASARYDPTDQSKVYWLHFPDLAMELFADPFDIADKLKALPPVEAAEPVGLGYRATE